MAWYSVNVTASVLVAVEAKDADEAQQLAYEEAFASDWGLSHKEAHEAEERTTPEAIEQLRRHANLELPLAHQEEPT